MDRAQHSFENTVLLRAAMDGDEHGVRKALASGADVNAMDVDGRTTLVCAVMGESWEAIDASDASSFMSESRMNVLKILLEHPSISLFTSNAPQDGTRGVTPLGIASWLDASEVVDLLLDASRGTVSVDGMDAHSATALMYAARDGNLEVMQSLISRGARPDFRDVYYRSSVHFALPHPRALWLCEHALRRHRWQDLESGNKRKLTCHIRPSKSSLSTTLNPSIPLQPPPASAFTRRESLRLANALVRAVLTANVSLICSILYPKPPSAVSSTFFSPVVIPTLVNSPDADGWSAIHYCASAKRPSIEVLDALYLSGADITLFTTHEHYTPLHCFARMACIDNDDHVDPSLPLYLFIVHLVRDLRAPLSARDMNQETCIHIASEHGTCIDVLIALLACDTTCTVREMKNSRGLTALEVAKPEFRSAFGVEDEKERPISPASVRTVRPSTSFASISSFAERSPASSSTFRRAPPTDLSKFDAKASSQQLLNNLRYTSPLLYHESDPMNIESLQDVLLDSAHVGRDVLAYYRAQTDEALKNLRDARATFHKIDDRLDVLAQAAREKFGPHAENCAERQAFMNTRRRNRDSADSDATAVSSDASSTVEVKLDSPPSPSRTRESEGRVFRDIAVSTVPPLDVLSVQGTDSGRMAPWPQWLDSFVMSTDSSMYKTHLANLVEIERELCDCLEDPVAPKDSKVRGLMAKKQREEAKLRELHAPKRADASKSGTGKLKAWLKRKIAPERPLRLEIIREIDESGCAIGRECKPSVITTRSGEIQAEVADSLPDDLLRSSYFVLTAAGRDMKDIEDSMAVANQFISTVYQSISRADRIIHRALEVRRRTIDHIQLSAALNSLSDLDNDLFTFASRSSLPRSRSPHSPSKSGGPSPYLSVPGTEAHSSNVSLAATLTDGDDEDTRALRRLIVRKIEARIDAAFAEIEKVNIWLHIIREAIRGVANRASL